MDRIDGGGERHGAARRARRPIALAGLVLFAASFAPGWIGLIATMALATGTIVAILVPLQANRSLPVYGWYGFAGSFVLFGLAGMGAHLAEITGQAGSTETLPLNTAGCVIFLAGHLQIARDHRGGRAVADIIDIVVIGAAAGIVGWRVLWAPRLPEGTVGPFFFLITLAICITVAVRLVYTGNRDRRLGRYHATKVSGRLILASYLPVTICGAAVLCNVVPTSGSTLVAVAWPLSAALLALALNENTLLPHRHTPVEVEAPVDHWRLVLIGAATPVPLIVGLATDLNGPPGGYVFGLGIVMSALVTVRTGLAFRRIRSELDARIAAEAELAQQERYDTLTGLPNRTLFRAHLEQAIARADHGGRGVLAVLYLDLDRFKVINDGFGQRAGDLALIAVADRLREAVRDEDMAARLSGDEFAVILESLGDVGDAYEIAERVREEIRCPIEYAGTSVVLSVSVGLSVYDDEIDTTDLLREADVALSSAKRRGGNAVVGFDARLRTDVVRDLSYEHDLMDAVGNDELRLHYQPQIDLASGTICGVEALIRWEHPTHGLLAPAAFIDIAEQTGLIVPIGAWVIEEACRQHRRWQAVLGAENVPPISINVSPTQLVRDDVAGRLERALAGAQLDADQIHIEITEVVLMGDSEQAIDALEAIDLQGVTIAVDDFGTGYFSLSHLRRFPVHLIKIDQSFVQGIGVSAEDEAIIDATIHLAHALGLSVVAEGVETDEQLAYLRLRQCDTVQGFLFAKPMPPAKLAAYIGDQGVTVTRTLPRLAQG
jgi:diguanylate cyclase (GGDEF)-like protein